MAILQACRVSKTYGEGAAAVEALRGVDLSVQPGEFLAIMGPSGSGKSTLLHLLGGLDVPSTGQVLLEGVDLAVLNDQDRSILRRRRIGFIFQKINLLPTLNCLENVAMPLLLDGIARSQAFTRAQASLDLVGVAHRGKHLPTEVSGGEQQRVAIARALVIKPAVILADEPTGALNTELGDRIVSELRRLVAEQGQTVVVVTHDPKVAAAADRTVVVMDGRLRLGDSSHAGELEGAMASRGALS